MYCQECGTKVSDTAKFCQVCGYKLTQMRVNGDYEREESRSDSDKLLDVKEACSGPLFNKISPWTFYELVKKRKIPVVKIGRRIFVRESIIQTFIKEQEALSIQQISETPTFGKLLRAKQRNKKPGLSRPVFLFFSQGYQATRLPGKPCKVKGFIARGL